MPQNLFFHQFVGKDRIIIDQCCRKKPKALLMQAAEEIHMWKYAQT
jgi:hypothetical protein